MSSKSAVQGVWYGIDLGTTNSSISYLLPDGRVDSIAVSTGPESKIIPSAVFWQGSRPIVGQEALDASIRKASGKTLISYKPFLNTPARGITKWVAEDLPGKAKDDFHAQCIVHVGSKTVYKLVTEKNSNQGGSSYALEDVIKSAAAVFAHLIHKANNSLGITHPEGVVVGIPVGFGDAAKERVSEAVFESGQIEDKRKIVLVPEPLTVALQYGVEKKGAGRILVFDFGGGTLDLCVVELKGEIGRGDFRYKVLAKDVYNQAGSHFDRKLLKYIVEKYMPDFYQKAGIRNVEQLKDVTFWGVIENLKKRLTEVDSWYLSYDDYGLDENPVLVIREDFEAAIQEDLDKIRSKVKEVIKQAKKVLGYTNEDGIIDEVYLAGGSSLIPAVKEILNGLFPEHVRDDYAGSGKVTNGYALTARHSELIEDTLDYTYGIWDFGREKVIPVLERGLPLAGASIQAQISDEGGLEIDTAHQEGATVALFAQQNERWEMVKEFQVSIPGTSGRIRLYFTISPDNKQFSISADVPGFAVETLQPGTIPYLEPGQIIKYHNGVVGGRIGCIKDIINISKGKRIEMVVGELQRRYRLFIDDPKQKSLDKQVLDNEQLSVLDLRFPLPGESIDLTRVEYNGMFIPFSTYKTVPFTVLEQEGGPAAGPQKQTDIGTERTNKEKEGYYREMHETKTSQEALLSCPEEYKFTSRDAIFVSIYESFRLAAEELQSGLAKFNKLIELKTGEINKASGQEALDGRIFLQSKLQEGITALLQLQEVNRKNIQEQLFEAMCAVQRISAGLQGDTQEYFKQSMKEFALNSKEKELTERILKLPEEGRKKIINELNWLERFGNILQVAATEDEC